MGTKISNTIAELRKELAGLGEVNMPVLEDYDELVKAAGKDARLRELLEAERKKATRYTKIAKKLYDLKIAADEEDKND